MSLRIDHIQITAPPGSADAVRWFYGTLLGLTEIPLPPAMANYPLIWFQLGQQQLHVGVEPHADRLGTHAHLAYHADDVPAWRQKLAAHGFLIVEQPPIPGHDRFHTRDPFGNRIEFIGPRRD